MQHFLESELGGLEQVRVPRPRRELGSTISGGKGQVNAGSWAPCHPQPLGVGGLPHLVVLRVLEVQRAAVVRWLLRESKGAGLRALLPTVPAKNVLQEKRLVMSEAILVSWPEGPCPVPALTRKARQRHICPRRHTRPCHVLLSTSLRLAFSAGMHTYPHWRPDWGERRGSC